MSSKEEFLKRFRADLINEFHGKLLVESSSFDQSIDSSLHLAAGSQIAEYQIIKVIGEGGMGTVYEAVHTQLRRKVALKILKKQHESSPEVKQRFLREIRAVGVLSHPGIVQAFDARYEVDGPILLAFELLHGADLNKVLKSDYPISIADSCEIARQVAEGLQHIQDNALVHRDIKPSNLFCATESDSRNNNASVSIKILDLGLAVLNSDTTDITLTSMGQIVGTIDYIAPEQIQSSRAVDIRADIYSLGCTLYHLLAGAPPFHEYVGTYNKLHAHKEVPPKPIKELNKDVPDGLCHIVMKLLEKKADDRYELPFEICEALSPYCSSHNLLQLGRSIGTDVNNNIKMSLAAGQDATRNAVNTSVSYVETSPRQEKSYRTRKWFAWFVFFSLIMLVSLVFFRNAPSMVAINPAIPKDLPALAPHVSSVLMFDGVDDTIETPFKYFDGNPITFEIWFTLFATPDRRSKTLVSNAETAGISLEIKEDNYLRFLLHDGKDYRSVIVRNCIVPGKKTHVAAVYDGISIQLYVNGTRNGPPVPVRSRHRASPLPIHLGANPDPVLAGRDVAGLRDNFFGVIHQFRISSEARYTTDFTPDKILASESSTELLYHIDSGQGDTIKDLSGNGKHGRIIGGEWISETQLKKRDANPTFSWPEKWPAPAVAPLSAEDAIKVQKTWAEFLGVEPQKNIDLGGEATIRLVLIPPGQFLIGTDSRSRNKLLESTELKTNDFIKRQINFESPQHLVKITKPFYMSTHEITRRQYSYFCRQAGFEFQGKRKNRNDQISNIDDYPIVFVTWNDSMAFCDWLSVNSEFPHVTLPTEAQWEYACRAGKTSIWNADEQNSLNLCCWYSDNSNGSIHEVGLLLPNQWGLFDMQGNASEWCRDFYRRTAYTTVTQIDPVVGSVDHFHNVRGGSWAQWPVMCRPAYRSYVPTRSYNSSVGFRIIAEIESPLLNISNSDATETD